jgi:hypothetical protein
MDGEVIWLIQTFHQRHKYYKFNLNVVVVTLHNSAPSGPQGFIVVASSWAKRNQNRRPLG